MRRKFELKVCYTFHGYFTLRAASGKEAARLVSEHCGTVLNTIQTTLGEESEVDWQFDKHTRLAVRKVIALPETIDGEKLPRVQIFHPGQQVFRSDPDDPDSGTHYKEEFQKEYDTYYDEEYARVAKLMKFDYCQDNGVAASPEDTNV